MTLITSLWFSASVSKAGSSDIVGQPIPNLRWIGSKQGECTRCLNDSGAKLAECDLVSSGDVAAAFQELGGILVESAQKAGCKLVTGSRPLRHQRRDKP